MITAAAIFNVFNAGPTLTRAEFKQYPKDYHNKKKFYKTKSC